MKEESGPLISVRRPDNELTLLRMKCLISIKRRPDMSPDSKGEMNQEATGEGRGERACRQHSRARPSRAAKSARKVPTSALRKYSLGTTALKGFCSLRMNDKIRVVRDLLLGSILNIEAGETA